MYQTDLEEVRQAYALAHIDKRLVIEDEEKILVVVELTKEQASKIEKKRD